MDQPFEKVLHGNLDRISLWLDWLVRVRAVWTLAIVSSSLILDRRRDFSNVHFFRLLPSVPHWWHVRVYRPLLVNPYRTIECRTLSHLEFVSWVEFGDFLHRLVIACIYPVKNETRPKPNRCKTVLLSWPRLNTHQKLIIFLGQFNFFSGQGLHFSL